MEWIKLENELPPNNVCVWVRRKYNPLMKLYNSGMGLVYIGVRHSEPIFKNLDPLQNCHWQGRILFEDLLESDKIGWTQFYNTSFSDITIDSWSLTHLETELSIRTVLCEKYIHIKNRYVDSFISKYKFKGDKQGFVVSKK